MPQDKSKAQSRMWAFTIFDILGEGKHGDFNLKDVSYFCWQLEKCPTTERLHYQGFVVCERTKRLSAMKKIHSTAHWESCNGSFDDNKKYCTKEESRIEGPWEKGTPPMGQGKRTDIIDAINCLTTDGYHVMLQRFPEVYVKYHSGIDAYAMKVKKLPDMAMPSNGWYIWQVELLNYLLSPPDNRTIVWVYDFKGGRGKSTLCKFLICNHNGLLLQGKINDMSFAYDEKYKIVMFDVSRTQAENLDHLYSFAEQLKNGVIFSPKYTSGMKVFSPPHVVFFANSMPQEGKWTEDRLKLIDLSD